jgi:hypothetical protein
MAKGIPISKKHGVNPCIPVCFWCGEDKNEVASPGNLPGDAEAPMRAYLDFEPCKKCKEQMDKGITLVGVSKTPQIKGLPDIGGNAYPTGAVLVIREDSELCQVLLSTESEETRASILKTKKCLIDDELLRGIIADIKEVEEETNESNGN